MYPGGFRPDKKTGASFSYAGSLNGTVSRRRGVFELKKEHREMSGKNSVNILVSGRDIFKSGNYRSVIYSIGTSADRNI